MCDSEGVGQRWEVVNRESLWQKLVVLVLALPLDDGAWLKSFQTGVSIN